MILKIKYTYSKNSETLKQEDDLLTQVMTINSAWNKQWTQQLCSVNRPISLNK